MKPGGTGGSGEEPVTAAPGKRWKVKLEKTSAIRACTRALSP